MMPKDLYIQGAANRLRLLPCIDHLTIGRFERRTHSKPKGTIEYDRDTPQGGIAYAYGAEGACPIVMNFRANAKTRILDFITKP